MIYNLFFNDNFIQGMVTILAAAGVILFFLGAGIEKVVVSVIGVGLFLLAAGWSCIRLAIILVDQVISAWV